MHSEQKQAEEPLKDGGGSEVVLAGTPSEAPGEKPVRKSYATIALGALAVLLVGGGAAAYFASRDEEQVSSQVSNGESPSPSSSSAANEVQSGRVSPSPSVTPSQAPTIKNMGITLGYYDPATGKAGDLQFTKKKFAAGDAMQLLFTEFGYEIPGNSATGGVAKRNVQPTFIVPLGTQVRSLVDGVVFSVPKLYSNDYSVMVQVEGSDLVFETEHVINVKVKEGDVVKAGDVIAEVSDYDAKNYAGLGLFEIGVLKGGSSGPPSHLCPFDFLDESIKDETFKMINALKKSWEEYRGNTNLYNESAAVVPGCLTQDPIEG